jgi:hypothetical protein
MKKPRLKRLRKVRAIAVNRSLIAGLALVCAFAQPAAAASSAPTAAPSSPPDVKTLVARYAHAMHLDKIARIRSIAITASGYVNNHFVTYSIMAKAPDKYLEIVSSEGTGLRASLGFDGTIAWAQDVNGTVIVLSGEAARWVEGLASGAGGDPRSLSVTSGESDVNGTVYYVIRLRDARGYGRDLLLDEKTYLPMYGRIVAGTVSHLYAVGPLDTGPLGESYARMQQVVKMDGSLGNPAAVTSVDDNIALPDSMFAPPGQ